MSLRGGRDRPRRDFPSRSEEKSHHHGRSSVPPSRHLWVGNLSHTLTERALSDHFREFGELESVAFQPGRSYAFINFINEDAAIAAIGALQGFMLAGNAIRIEFAKAEKSSSSSHDEDYLHNRRDEPPRSSLNRSPFPQRDSRSRNMNSEPIYNHENNNNNTEASEVLWVGFPQSLKVSEDIFWDAFSPFGEIEKISFFPGRTYAFIRFKHLSSACRAKESLHGKLFGNPRVHISFSKHESAARNSIDNNKPPSPRVPPYGHRQLSSENFRYRENSSSMERNRRSPRFVPDDQGVHDSMGFDRRGYNRNVVIPFEQQQRFQEPGPTDRLGNFHDYPPQNFKRQAPLYDDEWDLPEDSLVFHDAKKRKNSVPPPEPELPEYPFSDPGQPKRIPPRLPEFSQHEMIDNNLLGHYGYHKQQISDAHVNIPDAHVNIPQVYGNSQNASYDNFQTNLVSLPQNPVEWKKPTPEPGEWKWEGVIAKGGTSICRARCFPVGKVLDMILPEFLDCTARTSLEMLAKHYYQAASSWVVFFVPESDADMAFYNEFMNYLGEKERAAVAKLDEKTTLFLVPPSDFSEKILKVPGKMSISGVILRLEQPSSGVVSAVAALPPPPPQPPLHSDRPGEASRMSFSSPSGAYQSKPNNPSLPVLPPVHVNRNMGEPNFENPNEQYLFHQQGVHPQNPVSGGRNMAALPPRTGGDFMIPANNPAIPRASQETTSSSNYRPGNPSVPQYGYQELKPATSSSSSLSPIQQDQLAQLASFLGNSRQLGIGVSMGEEYRQQQQPPNNSMVPDNSSYRMPPGPQMVHSPGPQMGSQQYQQVQQFQQQNQQNVQFQQQQNVQFHQQQQQEENVQEEDPQKRLQATLELAATLLKQIQQGKS